jgi:predicted phosphodiesterase
MRIAFVSDIHGNLPALDAVIAQIAAARVDCVVNLGDIVSGPLWPRETAARLMALDWLTMAGNHERQLLTMPRKRQGASDAFAAAALGERERAWLAALPTVLHPADDVYCCHGTPASDLEYFLETVTPDLAQGGRGLREASAAEALQRLGAVDAALVACGHSHLPRLVRVAASLVLNPGSVGLQAYDDLHPHPHHVETGNPLARWALAERGAAGWSVALLATPYDHEAAACRADANGRGDWADALRTGRVGRREAEVVG